MEKIFNKPQKVALILLSIREDLSTKIIEHLPDEEIKEIIECISKMGVVSDSTIQNLIEEFSDYLSSDGGIVGSQDRAELFLRQNVSSTRAEGIIKNLKHDDGYSVWNKISNAPDNTLFRYLQNEHPQTTAFIFRKLDPQICAKIINIFDQHQTKLIIKRILKSNSIADDICKKIKDIFYKYIIGSNCQDISQNKYEQVALIASNMDKANEKSFIQLIENTNMYEAEKIKNLMFSFDDFLKISSEDIKILIGYVDKRNLALALKGTSELLRDAFLSVLPERARRNIFDEMEDMGNVEGSKNR